ncbi:MAG: hypothetical protein ACOYI8_01570 [Christensenellales bacterium]|jgi:CBS domain-containing protein
MSRAETFLKRYRVLEDALETRYAGRSQRRSSVVAEFLAEEASEPYRERLNLARELRNLISHSADLDGGYIAEPSEELVGFLNEVIDYVKEPSAIADVMTPFSELLFAQLYSRLLPVMQGMEQKGFSHVPVLKKGKLFGVLSHGAVFTAVTEGALVLTEKTTLSELERYLPIENHISEQYDFLAIGATLFDARNRFLVSASKKPRLAAIFITRNGSPGGKILGMLTMWDTVMPRKERGVFR